LNRGVVAGFDLEPHDFQSVQQSERLIDLGTGGVAIEDLSADLRLGHFIRNTEPFHAHDVRALACTRGMSRGFSSFGMIFLAFDPARKLIIPDVKPQIIKWPIFSLTRRKFGSTRLSGALFVSPSVGSLTSAPELTVSM